MTCGSKKHIEEALAKIHVHDGSEDSSKEEEEVKAGLRRKERSKRKVTTAA